jgi:imidazolonepropionase-like amidohydrolase
MTIRALAAAAATICCVSLGSSALAQSSNGEERYVILVEGEAAGHVRTTTQGAEVEIDYMVSNNGRGPRLRQHLTLGADGLPREWRVEGNSAFGGPVEENFTQTANRANWSSQADEGAADVAQPMLYVANDDTPWSQGLYARALLADPDHELNVLPGGAIRLEEVRVVPFGTGARRTEATIYRLIGLGLAPSYFMLDRDRRLLATVSGGSVTVREGYEDQENALHDLSHTLESEHYRALQERLAHRMDAPVRIRNVRVFDPATGQVGPLSAVTYFDDVVTSVETQGANDTRTDAYNIDGQGGVLVPGLHDMHAHVSQQSALLYLSAGVTSVRDMGNDSDRMRRLMGDIQAGAVAGPRIVPNGIIEGRSPYSDRDDVVADSLEEAIEGVRWYAAHGYWQIKIYNSLHPEWMRPVVEEAHRLGMTVTGHVPAFVTADQAIEAGYDDIAHTNQLMLGWLLQPGEDTRTAFRVTAMERMAELNLNSRPVRHTIDLMRRNEVALDTTLVIGEALMLGRARQTPSAYAGFLDHMPIGYQRAQKRTSIPIASAEQDARYHAAFQRTLEAIGLLHRRGIQLLPSTDQGSGFSLHRELELYVAAGIPAAETLSLATLRAEQYFGRDQRLGSIARGKLADFLLVPNDPTQDIAAIRQVRMTVRGGVIYFPSEMHAALGIRPFAEPVVIEEPSVRNSVPDPGEAHED